MNSSRTNTRKVGEKATPTAAANVITVVNMNVFFLPILKVSGKMLQYGLIFKNKMKFYIDFLIVSLYTLTGKEETLWKCMNEPGRCHCLQIISLKGYPEAKVNPLQYY